MAKKRIAETLSLFQLVKLFPDDDAATRFFEEQRWDDKQTCARCSSDSKLSVNNQTENSYWCGECRKYFSVRTNTVMEKSRISIRKWLYALYLLVTARKGISSLQLSKEIDVTQKTSWFMLQRIREACGFDGGNLLKGEIEVDETYFGGKEKNRHANKRKNTGRGTKGKDIVMGMRQRDGRTVAMPVDDRSRDTLHGVINETVEQGSTVYTDEWLGYNGLEGDYKHRTVNHSAKEFVNGKASTNGIESVWAILKRGHDGTFHHFSQKHLQLYINEFTFRLDFGNCELDTIDRIKAVCRAMVGKTLTYKELTGEWE